MSRAATAALLLFANPGQGAEPAPPPMRIEVVGASFRIVQADGERLEGERLVGTVLTVGDAGGTVRSIRIDGVTPDPGDPLGEITLYRFSVQDPQSGSWRTLCTPDADGFAGGFPLSHTVSGTGEHRPADGAFAITCTSGTEGKCVRMGYKPWATSAQGVPLRDLHQACSRMLRADYCGDGTPHTRDGTQVEVWDTLGIQTPSPEAGLSFEAAWDAGGAVCVRKPRLPDLISLDALVASCPERLQGRVGENCSADAATRSGAPLILNGS